MDVCGTSYMCQCDWRLFRTDAVGNSEVFAAFGAAACKYFAAVGCGHALTETVFVESFAVVGLVCTFHCEFRFTGLVFY